MSFPVAISHNHFSSNSLLLGFIKVLVPAFENLIKQNTHIPSPEVLGFYKAKR